jgi:hypothetical protein
MAAEELEEAEAGCANRTVAKIRATLRFPEIFIAGPLASHWKNDAWDHPR